MKTREKTLLPEKPRRNVLERIAAWIAVGMIGQAQAARPVSPPNLIQPRESKGQYTVGGRGPNHRIWQRVTWETNHVGKIRGTTNSYTELGFRGCHYLEDGKWVEAEAKIELAADGAVATKGNHKVHFSANANTRGAIDVTPAGQREAAQMSRAGTKSYYDNASGQSVMIADIHDSIGQVLPPNRKSSIPTRSPHVKADIRYTYTGGRI